MEWRPLAVSSVESSSWTVYDWGCTCCLIQVNPPINTMITHECSPDKEESIDYSAIAQVIRDRCCATSVSPLLPLVCPPCTACLTCCNRWNIALLLVTQCLVIPVFPLPSPVSNVSQLLHFKPGRDPVWALCHIISTVCTVNLASLFFSHCNEEV